MTLHLNWSIREARESDLDRIMQLEHASFGSDAWSENNMRAELVEHHTYYLVAEIEGDLVGYAGLSKLPSSEQSDIQTIAVATNQRGTGLGRELMHRLIGRAKELGSTEMFLEVRADNPAAQKLYLALGFEHIWTTFKSHRHLTRRGDLTAWHHHGISGFDIAVERIAHRPYW